MTPQIHQGQRYQCAKEVYLALENGSGTVRVAKVDHDLLWPLHSPILLHASQLVPLPVRRFGGEVR